ncbi:hypothetical protein DFR61_1301, partial [Kurthia zopfii]
MGTKTKTKKSKQAKLAKEVKKLDKSINVNTNMYISACIKMYRFTHFLYLNNLLFGK